MQHIDDCTVSSKGIVTSYNHIFCIPQPVHSHRIVSSKIFVKITFAKITFAKRKWKVIFAKVIFVVKVIRVIRVLDIKGCACNGVLATEY